MKHTIPVIPNIPDYYTRQGKIILGTNSLNPQRPVEKLGDGIFCERLKGGSAHISEKKGHSKNKWAPVSISTLQKPQKGFVPMWRLGMISWQARHKKVWTFGGTFIFQSQFQRKLETDSELLGPSSILNLPFNIWW